MCGHAAWMWINFGHELVLLLKKEFKPLQATWLVGAMFLSSLRDLCTEAHYLNNNSKVIFVSLWHQLE